MNYFFLLSILTGCIVSCAPYPQTFNPIANPQPSTQAQNQASSSTASSVPATLPVGRVTAEGTPNMVISPYKPYNLIDVKGYKSGEVVGDPSTAITDPKTGKVVLSTSKHFLIP